MITSMGKSSSRPASMSNISTHLDRGLNNAKFWVGPTSSSPGPILFRVASTAVKFVVRSYSSRLTISRETKSTIK